ncbi:hypothetical protein AURDEDRAFT_159312 [Auricularia subglabra TFB-10046 SS5]|nr:hypothetical protein AURDEDRAFT_159312 [Auricularia subglabra TFB-10046 SS5]
MDLTPVGSPNSQRTPGDVEDVEMNNATPTGVGSAMADDIASRHGQARLMSEEELAVSFQSGIVGSD